MSMDELAVMDGGKCILQLRGVRPFLSDKYDITAQHTPTTGIIICDCDSRVAYSDGQHRVTQFVNYQVIDP